MVLDFEDFKQEAVYKNQTCTAHQLLHMQNQ
jgi:hypothetical protein